MDSASDIFASLTLSGNKTYNLKTGNYIVGNASSKEFIHDIKIDDNSLDIKHAAIVISNNEAKLVDLFSQHGTYIDGKRVNQLEVLRLPKVAKLQFGSVICHFRGNYENDSGFLALNDSILKDTSIIPNTPTNDSSHTTRTWNRSGDVISTPVTTVAVEICSANRSRNDTRDSFLVAATQIPNEYGLKDLNGPQNMNEDDDSLIPETQEVSHNGHDDLCDMFQLNTQDFRQENECSNDSDNLIANVSYSAPIRSPTVTNFRDNTNINQLLGAKQTLAKVNANDSDDDYETELSNLRMDEISILAGVSTADKTDLRSASTTPDLDVAGNDAIIEDFLMPTQVFVRPHKENIFENITKNKSEEEDKHSVRSTASTPDINFDGDDEYIMPTQAFKMPDKRNQTRKDDGSNLKEGTSSVHNMTVDADDEYLMPTQAFKIPRTDKQTGLNNSSRTDNHNLEELNETEAFVIPERIARIDETQSLEQTQIFHPKVSNANHSFSVPSIDQFEKARNSTKKSIPEPEASGQGIKPEIFKLANIPSRSDNCKPSKGDDETDFETTQVFRPPFAPVSNNRRSVSPILLDSEEEDNDPEFCLGETQIVEDAPQACIPGSKNSVETEQKRNKLFGSDDEDDGGKRSAETLFKQKQQVNSKDILQSTPNFSAIKLPNVMKLNVADELFRRKFQNLNRQKTLLEESSDEDDANYHVEIMDRLLSDSQSSKSMCGSNDHKQFDGKSKEMKVPAKRTTRTRSSASVTTKESKTKTSTKSETKRTTRKGSTEDSSVFQVTNKSSRKTRSKSPKEFKKSSKEKEESKYKNKAKDEESIKSSSSKTCKFESKEISPTKESSSKGKQHKSSSRKASVDITETKELPDHRETRQRQVKKDHVLTVEVANENVKSKKDDKLNTRIKISRAHRNRGDVNTSTDNYLPDNKLGEFTKDINPISNLRNCKVLLSRANIPGTRSHETKKRTRSHKGEPTIPEKRSKENDPSQLKPVIEESSSTKVRKSSRSAKPRILFTKLDSKPYEGIIEKIGGTIVDDPVECTVLITDSIYRTWKFLSALGKGVPIVTPKWLENARVCKEKRLDIYCNCDDYLVGDASNERIFQFTLKQSLERARHTPIFRGYTFHCTLNTKPLPKQLQTIIECAGGKFIKHISKDFKKPKDFFIVSDKMDIHLWPEIRRTVGYATIIGTEGILRGVLRQRVDFKEYLLSSK